MWFPVATIFLAVSSRKQARLRKRSAVATGSRTRGKVNVSRLQEPAVVDSSKEQGLTPKLLAITGAMSLQLNHGVSIFLALEVAIRRPSRDEPASCVAENNEREEET